MSHDDMNNCSGFNEVAAAFLWNSPKRPLTLIWTRRKLRRFLRFQT